jgi:predicted dehydrogenase
LKHSTLSGGDNLDLCLLEDFADCIIHDRPPSITGEDGMRAIEVFLAAYKAIRERCPVSLSPSGDTKKRELGAESNLS